MLDDVLEYLTCPYCGAGLTRAGAALRCPDGHAFDIARQGYASLLPREASGDGGDTAAMVAARADFLAAGHFAGLAAAVAEALIEAPAGPGCAVDCGAGTGYYLARLLDGLPGRAGIALERSRYALRRAARAHPRAGAVACDVWRGLPVATAAATVAINVFAPRNGAELCRILRPDGRLLVVTPNPDHLRELTGPLGLLAVDERKDERLSRDLGPHFSLVTRRDYRATMELDRPGAAAAALMGPSAWHAGPGDIVARVRQLPEPMPVTLSVRLSILRPA